MRAFRVPYVLLALATTSGLLAEAHARSVVETQQSTAYDLPDGWSVFTWTKETGEATLKNKRTGDVLIVKRYGTGGKPEDYSNSEEVAPGRTLTWEYLESNTDLKDTRLHGEVKLAGAIIRIVVWKAPWGFIDKNAGLAAIRSIAASVKILGPRKCWPPGEECPPGEVKESK